MDLPDWVAKFKRENVEIHQRGKNYYAYRISSTYVPALKRSKKKTEAYLGRITPEGIAPKRPKSAPRFGGTLDAGNIAFLDPFVAALQPAVREAFPEDWESLMAAAVLKLCYLEPCSRLHLRYETSLAKRRWPEAHVSDDSMPELLRRTGHQWEAQREVFRTLSRDEKHVAIDLSHVFSDGSDIPWLKYGHNGDDVWRPQLQLLLYWGTTTHRPGFLQLLLGATNSAQTIVHTIKEVPMQGVIAVVDKGFWSSENVAAFEREGVHYAMALRRDLPIVHLVPHTQYRKHFLYRERAQWWRQEEWEGRTIYHFLDKKIADEEETAYLRRIEKAKTPHEKRDARKAYREAKNSMGTLSILTDSGMTPDEAYAIYKERREIEYAFDALQNDLRDDVTWMRTREAMAGYHFILFLALHLYSQVLDHLRRKKLLSTYSVRDIMTYLTKVAVVEVDGQDIPLPVTRQTQTVLNKLEKPITQDAGL